MENREKEALASTDWFELWRRLAEAAEPWPESTAIKRYQAHSARGYERPDPLLDLVLREIRSSDTVLDIGAGNGRWSIPLAGKAASVTACEPAQEMRVMLAAAAAAAGRDNIRIVPESWEEARPLPHDVVICAHAIYASPDLRLFIGKMERCAISACYLAVRLPPADGVIGTLCRAVYGRTHDSPNAVIAYNALYEMGIYASVEVEERIQPWVNNTFEDAFARTKRHLHLESSTAHDGLIRATLEQKLTKRGDTLVWPDGMRTGLLWWHPRRA